MIRRDAMASETGALIVPVYGYQGGLDRRTFYARSGG